MMGKFSKNTWNRAQLENLLSMNETVVKVNTANDLYDYIEESNDEKMRSIFYFFHRNVRLNCYGELEEETKYEKKPKGTAIANRAIVCIKQML